MARNVTITPANTPLPQRTRVAAYARVSLGTELMLHSLAAQVSYYSKFIQNRPDWEYAGVYADADETGTRDDRPEFQRLLADCRSGKIQKVITKSISRFARNTVTLLQTVRELKELSIGVWFEEQQIDTLTGDGELMMTIIAGFAQEESRSVSENIKWRKRNDMKTGKAKAVKVYGFRTEGRSLAIVPEEAEVVKMVYADFLGGMGQTAIANKLNEMGIPSSCGKTWSSGTVRLLLINPKMCGNTLHQRTFITDHITKHQKLNKGELPKYIVEGSHEPIVSVETWEAVQTELARRGKIGGLNESEGLCFRKKLVCDVCGRKFHHTSNGKPPNKHRAWICGGRDKRTGANCTNLGIPEPTLMKAAAEILGLEEFNSDVFSEQIESVIVREGRRLTFVFKDGHEVDALWERRKTVPYSTIGFEKRIGRNICYSKCGKGNMSERRRKKLEKQKEAELNAECASDTGEEA